MCVVNIIIEIVTNHALTMRQIVFNLCVLLLRTYVKYSVKITSAIFSWLSTEWVCWNKYSEIMLRTAEKKILQFVKTAYRGWFVDIGPVVGPSDKIWTISLNTDASNTPLVLLHGLGAGVALWCMNFDALAANRPVYAMDILGFGRSSRPSFSGDAMEAEQQMVQSIEEWRKEMNLDKFVLLGHSLGGFLAAAYSISHPQHVQHLVLADPWGFPERPQNYKANVPLWIKAIAYTIQPLNPLWAIRAAGPFGEWVISKARHDIMKKFEPLIQDGTLISQYIYQCNAQKPSGESVFHAMMSGFGWAKHPMVNRIDKLDKDVPITLIYGSRSWVDNSAGEIIKEKRMMSFVNQEAISGAGHHVYADKADKFNELVEVACVHADESKRVTHLAIMPTPTIDNTQTKVENTAEHTDLKQEPNPTQTQ